MDLIEKQVDRIFYPWVVFERKEDEQSKNSFNCPIVSGYSDVIKSAINPEKNHGIPLDAPTISFKDEELLRASLVEYLATLNINEPTAQAAITQAITAQQNYLDALEKRNMQVFNEARAAGRMVILLAARPYHIDPLIQHKIADAIAAMGIDVITENVAAHEGQGVYDELNAMAQWAYPNRIFKAAHWVGNNPYNNLHMVELTSFGCGPDAFILDDVPAIMESVLNADVVCWATPIYYYEMSGQMKTLIDRMNAMYPKDYRFRDIYLLTTAAENEEFTPKRAESGLQGWIDCYEKCALKGHLFCGGVNDPHEISGHAKLQEAYELGKNI